MGVRCVERGEEGYFFFFLVRGRGLGRVSGSEGEGC